MIPADRALYAKVKAEADRKFLAPTSIYKSAWIVRTYKKRGGEFDGPQPDPALPQGLSRWFREKWVDLNRPGQPPCGRAKATTEGIYPLCRPSVRVSKQTPKLASEIDKKAIERAAQQKQRGKHATRVAF